jgi:WD40 repeat protein/S1-C subfamily serine protease
MLGTPDFIAPEQIDDAQTADIRADIYSLGCTLYYLLSGCPPFQAETLYDLLQAHHSMDAQLLNFVRPEVPSELAAMVAKMMTKEPGRRFQTPDEVAGALTPFFKRRAQAAGSPGPGVSRVDAPALSLSTTGSTQVGTYSLAAEVPAATPLPARNRDWPEEMWKSLIDSTEAEKPREAPAVASRPVRKRPRWLWPAVAGLVGLVAILLGAGVTYHITTDKGELVIATDDPSIEVVVKQGGRQVTIIDPQTKTQIELHSGKYELELAGGKPGLRLSTQQLTLKRGDKTVVTVRRELQPPNVRVQLARIGKAATAFVKVNAPRGQASGSAFCIHPSGLFLTTADVAQGELALVLDPSLQTEKAYPARVVRSDNDLDLALLRADGARDLPALSLGSDEGLEELMDVVALGFPLVGAQAPGRGHPAVSVNAGSITALRRQDGRLKEIQLAAELNPGNSGGPVLDGRGQVIGVVRSGAVTRGLGRTGINQAIPVSTVARFLARPEVQFSPPRLESAGLYKPARFEARVTPLLPSAAPLTVDLILKSGSGPERTARMQAEAGRYHLTAVPILGPKGPVTLRLMARFEDGSLEGTTTDRRFTAGGREFSLTDVRTIWPGSPARVSLRDGTTTAGALSGLDAVPVPVGPQTLPVRLDRTKEVNLSPVGQVERVACTLVVRQGDKEVYRRSQSISGGELVKIVEAARLTGHQGHVESVVVSPDGRHILSGAGDRAMILWDRATGREIRRLNQHGGQVSSVAFAPDGQHALSGGEDRVIRLWDVESGAMVREFKGHTEMVMGVAFSPDGRLAYSVAGNERVGADSAVRVWDVETGRQVGSMGGHRGRVLCLAVSVDGRTILSGGDTIILWDVESRTEIRRVRGHTGEVHSVAFLPDGRRAASSNGAGTISLWDIETGDELHCFQGHGQNWLAVSPDGQRLFSSSWLGRDVRLWDVEGRKQLDRVEWGSAQPTRISFTPDGRHVLCGGTHGAIRVYELRPAESGTSDSGSPVYLCDLQETQNSVGAGAVLGKNGDLGFDPGNGDRRIMVNGVLARKGLSMHATARGVSFARYQLDGNYTSFHSVAAANDSVRLCVMGRAPSPMTFSAVGDGRELWKSQPIRHPGESQYCTVNVTGVRQLELREYCNDDDQSFGHAVWVDPYVQ